MLPLNNQLRADPREEGIDPKLRTVLDPKRTNRFSEGLQIYFFNMNTGIIARLTDKGFGFIKIEGKEKDLFFHSNALVNIRYDELHEGDKVSFGIGEGPKGPNATEVSKID